MSFESVKQAKCLIIILRLSILQDICYGYNDHIFAYAI
jgi:hypothetical protein